MGSILAAVGLVMTRIGVAVLLKLMLGSDDLVFLAPFMARARKVTKKVTIGVKYLVSVVFLTLVACALAAAIHVAADRTSDASIVDKIISTVAASLLLAYATHLAWEEGWFDALGRWCRCRKKLDDDDGAPLLGYGTMDDDTEDDVGPFKATIRDTLLSVDTLLNRLCCPSADADPGDLEAEKNADDHSVVVVAFLASMDDFMVYFSIALSGQMNWFELVIGISIGAALIALIVAALLETSETLADFIETVPIPLILAGLGTFILVAAWTGFPGHTFSASHHHASDGNG